MRAALPIAALLGVFALAAAPAEPLRLSWKVHDGCPDANAFWTALVSRSDRVRRASTGEPARKVSVDIAQDAKGSVGRVAIEGAEPRTIAAATCGEVVDAIAIVTALVLDPTATPAPVTSSSAPAPIAWSAPPAPVASSAAPEPPPPARKAPVAPKVTQRPWQWSVGFGVSAFTVGVGTVVTTPVSFELAREVALRLNLARGVSDVVQNVRGPAARFEWWTARLDLCSPRGRSVIELQPCVALEGGALGGEPIGIDRPRSDRRLWLAAHLLSRFSVALGRASYLELEGGTAVTLTRPEFYVEPDYFLYRPSAFLFHARAGLMVHFP